MIKHSLLLLEPIVVINSVRLDFHETHYIVRLFRDGKFDKPTIFEDDYYNDMNISARNALGTLYRYTGAEYNNYNKDGISWNVAANSIGVIISNGRFYFNDELYSIAIIDSDCPICLNGKSYNIHKE